MMYELTMTYANGALVKEKNTLPKLMHKLSYQLWFTEDWLLIEIVNAQTGEVIALWENNSDYGVTTG